MPLRPAVPPQRFPERRVKDDPKNNLHRRAGDLIRAMTKALNPKLTPAEIDAATDAFFDARRKER